MEAKANPLKVDTAPMPKPGPNDVVVKNGAIAINPVDWKIQMLGMMVTKFPNILGTDIAGEVVEVGSEVKAFKKGDRVIAHCVGLMTGQAQDGGHQHYSNVFAILTSLIPDSVSFTDAVVLPLAISTASVGLYEPAALGLPYPTSDAKDAGKVILVWGGSGSVGSTAIQLAVASGVTVVATASAHNHSYCGKLGATKVVDYNSSSVVEDVIAALKSTGKEFAGVFDTVSTAESSKPSFEVLQKAGGSNKIVTVLPLREAAPEGLDVQGVHALSIATKHKEVGEAVWGKFVPSALRDGKLKFLPEALVVGKGLEKIQEGLNVQKKGVSAKKVVIEL